MKKFLKEFKDFAMQGNVTDMAIGVIIGTSFASIVTSLVNDILMPLIGYILGGFDFTSSSLELGGDSRLLYGNFIQTVINFLIIAFSIFLTIKIVNKIQKKAKKQDEKNSEITQEVELLTEIRDILQKK